MVCRPPVEAVREETLEIRDVSHEIMELVPQAPTLGRIRKLLQPSAWKGLGSDWEGDSRKKRRKLAHGKEEGSGGGEGGKVYTMDMMRSVVQASEAELAKGLRGRNVVEINGELMPPSFGPHVSLPMHRAERISGLS